MKKPILIVMIVALAMICMIGNVIAISPTSTSQASLSVESNINPPCSFGLSIEGSGAGSWYLDDGDNFKDGNSLVVTSTCQNGWQVTVKDSMDMSKVGSPGYMAEFNGTVYVPTDFKYIHSPLQLSFPVYGIGYTNLTSEFLALSSAGSGFPTGGSFPISLKQVVDQTIDLPLTDGNYYRLLIEFDGTTL